MEHTLQHGGCSFDTGCFTQYDAKSSLPGASQNVIRNIQYGALSKVQYDLER